MRLFLLIIIALPLADVLWWFWADRRLRSFPLGRPALWRWLLAAFCASQLAGYLWIISSRLWGVRGAALAVILAPLYVWHLVILPAAIVAIGIVGVVAVVRRRSPISNSITPSVAATESAAPATISRRDVLAAALVAAPPLLAGGTTIFSLNQLTGFRINRLTIPLANLPRDLDGMTIAHVSDVHVGRFTRPSLLPRVADAVNSLRADLILHTGDLIDFSIKDLPAGVDMLRRIDPRSGMFLVEGNHDLFEGRGAFEQGIRNANFPLLLNESATVKVRGFDVQILGLKWGSGSVRSRGSMYSEHATEVLSKQLIRDRGVFPILLAHHPHAFDFAAAAGVPLTLAGHTHGGQLMATNGLGFGPMMFKYWSGLYRKGDDAALVVSNGVGNWFPLRINAPAEIVHITLRRM